MVKNRGRNRHEKQASFRLKMIDLMTMRMIGRSKGQFIAVLTIIIIGIAIYTAMNMTAVNMNHTVKNYYSENNFADLTLQTGPVPSRETERLSDIPGVKQAMGRITMDAPMITDNENERVNLKLITATGAEDELNRSTVLKGRTLSGLSNEVLLIEQFAQARGIEPGDEIVIQGGGIRYTLKVAGIVANPEFIYLMESAQSFVPNNDTFGVCYVSEWLGGQISGLPGSFDEILIRYESGADEQAIIDAAEEMLSLYGVKQSIKQQDVLSNAVIEQELTQLETMAKSIPIVFLLVAGLILVMMLSRMVKKDRLKIGILKAIGYSNRRVISHYIQYALIAGVLGGAAGSVLGMAMAGGMTELFLDFFHIPLLRIQFYYSYMVYAILLSVIFCTLSGIIGARGVLKIAPADAMRSETPKVGKRVLPERFPLLWKRLSFSSKLITRNLFRNKKRTLFVAAGIAVTYAMMLFTTSMPDVMNQLMNEHFRDFQKMEYNIGFRTPVPKDAMHDMAHLIDVDYMEGKLEYPFELANGNKSQPVSIIGLERDTEFYSFRTGSGTNVDLPKNGMLITENLAKALDIDRGDTVRVKSYLPGRDDVDLRVSDVIKQTLGMNAYMEIDAMGALLVEKNVINGVYVNSKDPNLNEKLIRADNVVSVLSVADMRAMYEEYMTMLYLSIAFMVIFSGILGFSIVYNTTIVSLGERETELSSLRVLGFSKAEIFFMTVKENAGILLLGLLLGIPTGYVMAYYSTEAFSTDIFTIDMSPTISALIAAAIFTVGCVALAQLATYQKIKKLDFLQALKSRES